MNVMSAAQQVILWLIGAGALIALAGPAPNIATMVIVLIIVGLILYHWQDTYSQYLLPAKGAAKKGG